MKELVVLEPGLAGVPERGFRGIGRNWGEFVARALRRLRPKPLGENVALDKALYGAHLHGRLGELRRHGYVADPHFNENQFGVYGLL